MFDQVLTFCVYILLCESFKMNDLVCSMDRPPHTDGVLTVTQVHFGSCTDDLALVELLGIGASQRMFRKFIESSYITLDPKEQILEAVSV